MKVILPILLFTFQSFVLVDTEKCPNKISILSQDTTSEKINFTIRVESVNTYHYTLFVVKNGSLIEKKKELNSSESEITFSEDKLSEGHYRVVFSFGDGGSIVCNRKSIEVLNN